ncbi:MAG: Na+/H+ antiporter NhaC family protein [Bacteroidota bacterium]|nr:Na+/H+ antiporter NhaC family protein [Bacteroidota bacterium]MDX5431404.1 Na+/H+ antiporter NhaC family protein [Bacteroidota bacterium]MDX5470132.1 Na+/H+ antiporter NhaC family protein [Bacteroidota bacterium]
MKSRKMVIFAKMAWKRIVLPLVLLSGLILCGNAVLAQSATETNSDLSAMPAWLSILPPLLAIVFAILFKEVISSLFIGILAGVFIHRYYAFPDDSVASSFFLSITEYLLPAVADSGHMSVILFSILIGGMVALISKNGGMAGMVNHIARYAKTPKSAQTATWLLGILIFFDDYANTLVVGNTMRPVTDRLKISREKLAYIVDATAAPVASVAFVTTWIGAQLGYIQDGVNGIEGLNESPYSVFMSSLQFAFYPIFTLFFMWILIRSGKDFGPMFFAEKRARAAENLNLDHADSEEIKSLEPDQNVPKRAFNAVVPVFVLIIGTLLGLWVTGYSPEIWENSELSFGKKLSGIIGQSDSYQALLWSSLSALTLSIVMSISQRLLNLQQSLSVVLKGFGFMLNDIIILCLAWTLSSLTEHLHTALFITESLQSIGANPVWFPAVTFVLAALVSFSTGSSWSTMAILYPMLLPASWLLCEYQNLVQADTLSIFYNVVSCVLAGSVLGDHCSPISDTTILSSLATSCNHLSHVRTQMPYALLVGGISVILGTLPTSLGMPAWISYLLGFLAIYMVIRIFGKLTD